MRLSVREYSEQRNISYETTRRQLKTYTKELSGHVFKEGNTRYLDEEAVSFLDTKRQNKTQVRVEPESTALAERDEQIKALQASIVTFSTKLTTATEESKEAYRKLSETTAELSNVRLELLEEQHKREQAEEQVRQLQAKLESLEQPPAEPEPTEPTPTAPEQAEPNKKPWWKFW